jgi:hypothetical protein
MERRRFTQTTPLDQRLQEHAKRLREEARGKTPRVRDDLIRRARQAETTAHLGDWVRSPGLQPPK